MVPEPNEKYQLHLVCPPPFARPELKPAGHKLLTLTQQIIWSRHKTAKKKKNTVSNCTEVMIQSDPTGVSVQQVRRVPQFGSLFFSSSFFFLKLCNVSRLGDCNSSQQLQGPHKLTAFIVYPFEKETDCLN